MKKLSLILVSIAWLAGCGASPDGTYDEAYDETVAEEGAALVTGTFTLRNYQTGLCLGVQAGNSNPGTPLITWYCDGSANQKWTRGGVDSRDPSFFALLNGLTSNRCMTTGTSNGSPAKLDYCLNSIQPNMRWKPIYAGNDQAGHECYRFSAQQMPSKVFGVKAANTALGTPIILWEDYNGTHPDQLWCIY